MTPVSGNIYADIRRGSRGHGRQMTVRLSTTVIWRFGWLLLRKR